MQDTLRVIIVLCFFAGIGLFIATICYIISYITMLFKFKKYNVPINVKCVSLDETKVCLNQSLGVKSNGQFKKQRITKFIPRPTYVGYVNGKNYTFCRRKDFNQPFTQIGENTTIYINPEKLDCKDFYEKQEIRTRKRKKIIAITILSLLFIICMTISVSGFCFLSI